MAHKGEDENGSHYNKGGGPIKNKYCKKKRTSFVNDNSWWAKLSEGFKNLKRGGSYSPQKMVRRMEFSEGLSKNKPEAKEIKSEAEMRSNQNRVVGSAAQWNKLRQEHHEVFNDPNKPKDYWEAKRRSERESGYASGY